MVLISDKQAMVWNAATRQMEPGAVGGATFDSAGYQEISVTVPAPTTAPTLTGGDEGWSDFGSGHTYEFCYTYVGWNGETQASPAASISVSYQSRIGVLPLAPKATRAVGAKIYCREDGGAWHLCDITFLNGAGDSRVLGFAKPTGGGVVVVKNASGAGLPGSNTATDRDTTAIANPTAAPVLTVIAGMPPSTTFYAAFSYTAEDGTETGLSPISSGYTTTGSGAGQRVEIGHPGVSPPNGAVLINYYLGTSATAGAMKKQLTVPLNIVSPRIETYNASGAGHSAGTAVSRVSPFQQALDAAVAAGNGATVIGPVNGASYVPIVMRETAFGIKVCGVGTSGYVAAGKSSISYEGSISGVAFLVCAAFGWSVEGIEFTDPHSKVLAGLAYAAVTGGSAFVTRWFECTFQALASGGVGVHAPNEGRSLSGSHNASEQTFERCSLAGDAWALKLHSNQSGNFIFSDCYATCYGHSNSADSGDVYVAGFFGNSLFNFTSITGHGAYLYYIGSAPNIPNAGAGYCDLLIERNYSETSVANCDVFIDSTAGNVVQVTLVHARLQNVTGHERVAICAHSQAKIKVVGSYYGGNILFTTPKGFLDVMGGVWGGYFKQPTPTFPPAGDSAGAGMLTAGPVTLINKNGNKSYVAVNDAGDLVLASSSGQALVTDEAYDATAWNGSLGVPTKNAVRDKIESLAAGRDTVKVHRSSSQSINNTTVTAIDWNAEDWDSNTMHDNSTNPSRLTAKVAGKYLITAFVVFASNDTGGRQILFYKNGSQVATQYFANSMGGEDQCSVNHVEELAVNDYIEIKVWQASGGALNVCENTASYAAMNQLA